MPQTIRFFSVVILVACLAGCGAVGAPSATPMSSVSGPTPTPVPTPGAVSSTPEPIFAFWYDPWNQQITPAAVKPANVVIGLAPFNVSKAHAIGKLVMQYQTYYQAVPNSPLLTSTADLANVGFEINHEFVVNIFGTPANSYVMCPNSVIFHERVQQYVQAAINSGYDGLFVDNTFFDPPAHLVCDGSHAHVDSNALGGRAYITLLGEVRQTLKSQNPKAILMTNPGDPEWLDLMATGSPTVWDFSDYVLWEGWGYEAFKGAKHDNWDNAIAKSFQLVTNTPERVPKLVMLSYVRSITEASFAFAAAKIFGFNWTANLGVSGTGTYLNDIPFTLGKPIGPLPAQGAILHRTFEHGEVFVNASNASQPVTVPAGRLLLGAISQNIAAPTDLVLQPRTAAIVLFN